MLGKRIINTGGVSCTTDTTQILDGGSTQSTALYRFEDNANDTASSTGKFGKGAIFNGTSSVVTINSVFDFSSSFSISMWFNADTLPSGDYTPLFFTDGYGGSNSDYGIALYLYGNTIKPWIDRQATYTDIFTAGTLSTSTWHHVILTRTYNSKWELFLDGSSLGTYTSAGLTDNYTPSSFSTIGKHSNSAMWFDGKIDQVRIFNKALSTSEITTLYNETTTTANTLQILGDTSCIAAYTFEGNANDLDTSTPQNGTASNVTYDYSGTLSGATYVTGKFGKSASFDGTNDYISADNPNASGGARSFSAWIKTTSTGFQSIITNGGTSHARGLNMFVYNNKLYSTSGNGSGENYGPTSSANVNTGEWVHCALTMSGTASGSILKTYVNGTLDGTHTTTVAITDTSDAFRIGGRYVNGSYASAWFSGQIDQVRIFSKELSPGEVNSLYNETTTTAALGTITNPSTVAYYKMADPTDETGLYNLTGSNVDFNIQGKYGFAGKFNGTNSYLYAANSVQQPTKNFSVSCWVNFNTIKAASTGIVANFKTGVTPQVGWAIAHQNGTPFQFWADGTASSSGAKAQGTTNPVAGTWYNIIGTYDGTNIKIYVNGSLEGTTAYSATPAQTDQPLVIGRWYGNYNDYYIDGKIDQVRIFNKAISASEVTKLYNEIQCANTITAPESYFNTKLYAGNSGTNALTGVGFQPDLVWIKSRNNNYNPTLYDSVRGTGTSKAIYSNENVAENTYPTLNNFVSFDTNGFTLGATSHTNNIINKTSDNLVSWNWKGGGLLNKSASFNGSSSRITLPKLTGLTADVTVSGWVNIGNTTTSNRIRFIELNTNANGYAGTMSVLYRPSDGQWLVRSGNGTSTNSDVLTHTYTLTQLTWYNVCFTRDDSTNVTNFYVNGSLQDTETVSVSSSYPSDATGVIGDLNYSAGSNYNWLGLIDQVRIFNKAILASEVTTLYNETASTINTLQVLGDDSCVAAYPLGVGAGDLNNTYSGTPSNVTFKNPGHLTRNNNGTIESTVSANTESGFSIVTYSPNDTVGMSIGHGLGKAPSLVITKRLDTAQDWGVYTNVSTGNTTTNWLSLNDADAYGSGNFMNIKSSTLELPATGAFWGNGGNQVAYCFANVDGYQRIGSYVGNGSTNGPFIYTGFEPAFILVKGTTSSYASHWMIIDNKRDTDKEKDKRLLANLYNIETDDANWKTEFYSNGFQPKSTFSGYNHSSGTYLFWAIAANPDTTASTKANSFKTKIYTGNGGTQSITGVGFKPDFTWLKCRVDPRNHRLFDSVRGATKGISSDLPNRDFTENSLTAFNTDGFTLGTTGNQNVLNENYVSWNWKAADHDRNLPTINQDGNITSLVSVNPEAGFSIVKYTSTTNSSDTVGHGLSLPPKLYITKRLGTSASWWTYTTVIDGSLDYVALDRTDSKYNSTKAAPTSSVFTTDYGSVDNMITYCWHSVAGYSKIGTYEGLGTSTVTVSDVGFKPSFIMIKNVDATANWNMYDVNRSTVVDRANKILYPNLNNSEPSATNYYFDMNDSGFVVSATNHEQHNFAGRTYLYMAFA